MIGAAQAARDLVAHALAERRIATLDDRPFRLTAAQLAWVDGGHLVAGPEDGPIARMAAARYAALFANHVIGDMSEDGAAAAYVRILDCARGAFLKSLSPGGPADTDASRWENEGGATVGRRTPSDQGVRDRGERVAVS